MKILISIFSLSFFLYGASLEVSINGIDTSKKGRVLVYLFSDKTRDFYPFGKSIIKRFTPNRSVQKIVFRGIPKGQYAVTVFHDENRNDKLDENMFWLPTEGYGFSNNYKYFPSFRKSQININRNSFIHIKMNY